MGIRGCWKSAGSPPPKDQILLLSDDMKPNAYRAAVESESSPQEGIRKTRLRKKESSHSCRGQGAVFLLAVSLLVVAMLAAWGCQAEDWPLEDDISLTVILGARLIDGSGAEPIEDAIIVVEGTRIRAAGPRASIPVPKGGQRIDATGKTVMPGLVDLHVHYFGDRAEVERKFRTQLRFGVTTVRSIGADDQVQMAAIADGRARKIPAPRLYTAGLGLTHPKGHPLALPYVRRPATVEEAAAAVSELAEQKVDFIKMWVESKYGALPKITPEIREAVMREAAKRHIPAVAHIYDEADFLHLAGLGLTDFLHTVRDKEPMDEAFLDLCKSKGISFAPTLSVIERNWFFGEHPELLNDPEIRAALEPGILADAEKPETRQRMLDNPDLAKLKEELRRAQRFVKQMADNGVTLVLGSDSGAGAIPPGWGTHREMQLMAAAGLSPMEVIQIATRHGAERLGNKNFGVIAEGKIADLLLLGANPLEDISNTRKIERVMQAGKWLDPAAWNGSQKRDQ